MKAIYKGTLYDLGDNLNVVELTDPETGVNITVPYSDAELIIDPTDDEINNILPDYDQPLDQVIGCNVHGRLTYIRDLCKEMKSAEAIDEINKLLEFFQVEKH